MSALFEITRADVDRALREAQDRFARADAALKSFRFSYPATPEDFEEWKRLREVWDQCDEELQRACEDRRDFDQGKLKISVD